MPIYGKYKKRRPTQRRRGGQKWISRRSKTMGYSTKINSTNVFPRRLVTKFKYNDNPAMAISAGAGITDYKFNLNGLYDPDSSGTGHQPYGFDESMALYSRYRVYKCSWRIVMPTVATDTYHCTVVAINGNSTYSTQPFSRVAELPSAVSRSIAPGGNSVTFSGTCYLPKLNGIRPAEFKNDDRFIGTSGANPAEVQQLHICLTCEGSSMSFFPTVQLIYYAELLDVNIVPQS